MILINIDGTDKSGKSITSELLAERYIDKGYTDLNANGKSGAHVFRSEKKIVAIAPDGRMPTFIQNAYDEIIARVGSANRIDYLFLTSRTKGKAKDKVNDIINDNKKNIALTDSQIYTFRANIIQGTSPINKNNSANGSKISVQKSSFLDYILNVIGLKVE